MSNTLEQALYLATDKGFSVFPVPLGKKQPIISWKPCTLKQPPLEQVHKWFKGKKSNIAIATGSASGIFILDKDGDEGKKSLKKLIKKYGPLPKTLTVTSGNGKHYYFKYPKKGKVSNSASDIAPGIDIRGQGGCVIAPGSIHPSGAEYCFVDPDIDIAEAPEWLLDLVVQPDSVKQPTKSSKKQASKSQKISRVTVQNVWESPYRKYALAAMEKACLLVSNAEEGNRNDTLNTQAFSLGQLIAVGALCKREVNAALMQAALIAGLDKEEIKSTRESGLINGLKHPRDLSDVRNIGINAKPIDAITGTELMKKKFAPSKWAIDNLLPEGLTIIAGRPKAGKSWLLLDCALGVSTGENVLIKFRSYQGKVLYLALEDNQKRLQKRLLKLQNDGQSLDNLFMSCDIAKYDEKGLEVLEEWLDDNTSCRLVIIDTMRRYIKGQKGGSDSYSFDTESLGKLQRFAQEREIAIVLVHHTRKSSADDPMDEVLGSTGLTGVADAILVLKRDGRKPKATLHTTGRDFEDDELEISFDPETCRWALNEKDISEDRKKVLLFLKKEGVCSPVEIATGTGLKHQNVRKLLIRMANERLIESVNRGEYHVPDSLIAENEQLKRLLQRENKNIKKFPISLDKDMGNKRKNELQHISSFKATTSKPFKGNRELGNEYIELDLSHVK